MAVGSAEGVGLTNTRERLQTLYHKSASLTMRSKQNGGQK